MAHMNPKRELVKRLIICVIAIVLLILGFFIEDKMTRSKLDKLAYQIAETAQNMDSRFNNIESLVAEYGTPGEFLFANAVSKSDIDFDQNMRSSLGIGGSYKYEKNYKKVLERLEKEKTAYLRFLADESRTVYDSASFLLYFCNDTVCPIRNGLGFQDNHSFDKPTNHISFLHHLNNRKTVLNLVTTDENKVLSGAEIDLLNLQNQLDYLNNIEYMVFISNTYVLYPKVTLKSAVGGAISIEADIYHIDDKSFVESFKVFAESSSSIETSTGIVLQSNLDEDLQKNLEQEVIKALTNN